MISLNRTCIAVTVISTVLYAGYHGVDALTYPRKAWIHPVKVARTTTNFNRHHIVPRTTPLGALCSTISPNQSRPARKYQAKKSSDNKKVTSTNENLPWSADFVTSHHTQSKIQSAAASECSDPVECAQHILETLLNTPPSECNPANIVCALTLSAKTLPAASANTSNEGFHQSLIKTLEILQMLVDDNKLSSRQLCNAAWAIAKHIDHGIDAQYINDALDSIALRMTDHLERIRGRHSMRKNMKHVQTGELSMLLWAFAAAKPRDLPPGWERPPRFEQIAPELDDVVKKTKNKHRVTFVSVIDDMSDSEDDDDNNRLESATSRLFDAAAIAFCRGEGAAALQSSDTDNMTMLKNSTWSELSNVAWSFAARGAYGTKQSDAMMTFLAREATRRLNLAMRAPPILTGGKSNKFCIVLPRDVVQIAWALGTMESDNISIGHALVHLVDAINGYWVSNNNSSENYRQLRCFKNADLVQLASALAHGRLDNRSVLTAIYEESLLRLRRSLQNKRPCFTASELSILLWVQARLNLTEKYGSVFGEFPSAACQLIHGQVSGLRSQEHANLAWSITVLNKFDEHIGLLLQKIFDDASSLSNGTIQLEHAHQLWQAYFILRDDCPEAVKFVSPEFSHFLERQWNIEKGRNKHSSYRHKSISKTLELLGVAHQNESKEDVDVAIVIRDGNSFTHKAHKPTSGFDMDRAQHKIAVEFDGPHHFTVLASTGDDLSLIEKGAKVLPRVLGHTVLKYKMLKKKGWTVVRIPWYV
jgi:hypothetical protein